MSDNPIFGKLLTRSENSDLMVGEMKGQVEFTSGWEPVEGGKGVTCRTWVIKNVDADVDGADIKIEKGGYTPIQLVNAAQVVVDAPEIGKGYCCVMTKDGKIHTNFFDGSEKKQMVWEKSMVISWIAKEDMALTEFESPTFHDEMFINIPDEQNEIEGRSLAEYRKEVNRLRNLVESS